ncbi:hypothetical protein IPF89_05080 [Candidatus Saccharibacteria bacterium]|nr:MAG: hypothetical protein IPF89_05080 [Candidatus Saccharibacteria bacterium]
MDKRLISVANINTQFFAVLLIPKHQTLKLMVDTTVAIVEKIDELVELHTMVVDLLEQNGAIFNSTGRHITMDEMFRHIVQFKKSEVCCTKAHVSVMIRAWHVFPNSEYFGGKGDTRDVS